MRSVSPQLQIFLWLYLFAGVFVFSRPHSASSSLSLSPSAVRLRHRRSTWPDGRLSSSPAVGVLDTEKYDDHHPTDAAADLEDTGNEYMLDLLTSDRHRSRFSPFSSYRLPTTDVRDLMDLHDAQQDATLLHQGPHHQRQQQQQQHHDWIETINDDAARVSDGIINEDSNNRHGAQWQNSETASSAAEAADAAVDILLSPPVETASVSDSEQRLFELLISALTDESQGDESKRNHRGLGRGSSRGGDRRKSPSKPCYWSLVSCY